MEEITATRPDSDYLSLEQEGIPFVPRTCFNWLPQYRYSLMAYKALQRACHLSLTTVGGRCSFDPQGLLGIDPPFSLNRVRPVLMDTVLRTQEWTGYVIGQSESALQEFATGQRYFPLSEDLALIVAKEEGSAPLLNNILPYMTPAPLSLSALFALAGGYSRVSEDDIRIAFEQRRGMSDEFRRFLAAMYRVSGINRVMVHAAGVGGLIEAATRYMHFCRPGYRSCLYVPEYWDLLRCLLTYSPGNVRVVEGRDQPNPDTEAWLSELSQPGLDFAYVSVTSNPLGSTLPKSVVFQAIDAVPEETLFFLDFTSVDIHETFDARTLASILASFPQKNLMLAKSFAKDYNFGHLRVGYALFAKPETALGMWPYMAAYPAVSVTRQVLRCLNEGNAKILNEYRRLNRRLVEAAAAHSEVRLTGTSSNYTSVYFKDEETCVRMKDALEREYGSKVFPGEIPMQGGGALGLDEGEINLPAMKRIPFLPPQAIRLLVTDRSIEEFFSLLDRVGRNQG